MRIEERVAALRRQGGIDRRAQCPPLVSRGVPVVGEFGRRWCGSRCRATRGAIGRPPLECRGVAGVQTRALAREQLAVDDFLEQRVARRRSADPRCRRRPPGSADPRPRGAPPAPPTRASRRRRPGAHRRSARPAADATRRISWPALEIVAIACQDDVAQPLRQLSVVRLARHGEDLFRVEGIPAGPLPRPLDQARIRRRGRARRPEAPPCRHDRAGKDPPGRRARRARARRNTVMNASCGSDSSVRIVEMTSTRSSRRFRTRNASEVPGGRIGPLEILDDEHDRRQPGEPLQDAEHELEEAHLRESLVARRPAGVRRRPPRCRVDRGDLAPPA